MGEEAKEEEGKEEWKRMENFITMWYVYYECMRRGAWQESNCNTRAADVQVSEVPNILGQQDNTEL